MVSTAAITSVILHLTFIITFLVVASLSRIFGAARKKKPLYKLYYVASFLMMLSMVLSMMGLDLRYMAASGDGFGRGRAYPGLRGHLLLLGLAAEGIGEGLNPANGGTHGEDTLRGR